ncbi:cysteine--1-D-myo-inosityl 2-amino-2-deoxy-alpha-D-glucopyranoside ligase [Rothia kristinae]|uniref:L-cysteine:1D-myo-inositol 2-amino-2-deoxy-alpha-D-glucopyranoside ligase n=1 Tax=Rothia kristinae TaxID=37923 RepID=A0A7T3CG17_9MICC|nr:cysteine--1-D-myo-inosityl 2-amino-2-deoxy-alpha-D-glucopyranoside ligase [Rothia kristinae]QPT53447.1 cysteine--1-D-myo-inosityl 2-amino-2-deoxy-alpha-D-glucopyranoside ligase [Rothia kristinae]
MKSWTATPWTPLPGHAPAPTLYDTRLARTEALPEAPAAGLYVCGITPYDATHMGHAATYVAFDLLHRALRDAGQEVTYVQNVTDVDDPLLERAEATGVDWRELAAEQTELFRTDMRALNVLPPAHYIGATEAVEWIVPWVETMLQRGTAYRVPGGPDEHGVPQPDGDVYFDVRAAADTEHDPARWFLGRVSGYTEEQMRPLFAERGGDPQRPGKRDPFDPLLWRVHRDGEPSWDGAALGRGRPGWHIECTVIADRFLGMPYTVQGGGSDLRFPHHEMGAGHAFAVTGQEMALRYAHTGMVGLDGEKMSKSRGNLVLVSTLRQRGEDPRAIRLAILAHHYREDWFWTDELLERSRERLRTWRQALQAAREAELTGPREGEAEADESPARRLLRQVRERLGDDLDAPGALRAVDAWADQALRGEGAGQAGLVRDLIAARLGVAL